MLVYMSNLYEIPSECYHTVIGRSRVGLVLLIAVLGVIVDMRRAKVYGASENQWFFNVGTEQR